MKGYFKVKDYMIPRVLLGTSPFIGAGQFEDRAYEYYLKFYGKPENVEEIALKSFEIGVRGVQILPYWWVYKGIYNAMKKFSDEIIIVGTMLPDEVENSINYLSKLNATAILIHASITDLKSKEILNRAIKIARKNAPLTGIVTHFPRRTLPWIKENNFEIDLILAPFNKYGYLMDLNPNEAIKLYREMNIPIIGKKILGAGKIEPKEAIEYAVKAKCLEGMALGVASINEAEETFTLALKLFS